MVTSSSEVDLEPAARAKTVEEPASTRAAFTLSSDTWIVRGVCRCCAGAGGSFCLRGLALFCRPVFPRAHYLGGLLKEAKS